LAARALVDTGAIAALFNQGDPYHEQALSWFRDFRGQLLTTEAVVTETAYVLMGHPAHQHAALLWLERARAAKLMRIDFSVYRLRGRKRFRIVLGARSQE
jgi:predicted nucleic acid-binding protein